MNLEKIEAVIKAIIGESNNLAAYINYNDHHVSYQKASDVQHEMQGTWFSPDDRDVSLANDTVWEFIIYSENARDEHYFASTLFGAVFIAANHRGVSFPAAELSQDLMQFELQLKALLESSKQWTSLALSYEPTDTGVEPPCKDTREWLTATRIDDDDFVTLDEKAKVIEQKSFWRLQWYPTTPIGSYTTIASSLVAIGQEITPTS